MTATQFRIVAGCDLRTFDRALLRMGVDETHAEVSVRPSLIVDDRVRARRHYTLDLCFEVAVELGLSVTVRSLKELSAYIGPAHISADRKARWLSVMKLLPPSSRSVTLDS